MSGLRLGIDIGSTTIKAVLLDGATVLFEDYRRHNADIQVEIIRLLHDIAEANPGVSAQVAVTGSGGLGVADLLGTEFIQEVIAETRAIQRLDPEADVIIELGGEDAKMTYLKPVPEQRMNGTCAGGTGAFIDQMATLLRTDAAGLNELASHYTHLYPIASRCGVFAKSDLQPLLNDGAPHEDLAASIFQAVATQTIAGLACGRPIRGKVVFLGGPLFFLPELRAAFARALEYAGVSFDTPERAQLFIALGAAMLAGGEPIALDELHKRSQGKLSNVGATERMRPLFIDEAEKEEFDRRHGLDKVEVVDVSDAHGACFLGIDAGSTTIKAVVMDADHRIVYSRYQNNGGDPVAAAIDIVTEVRHKLPHDAIIACSCVTGYGEGLIKAALHIDEGEVETMAHYRAAAFLRPDVTSVIDIGGQDMKYLRIRDGVIDSISVNEACSSGCGSFLQTFAEALGLEIQAFAQAAEASFTPVDLGSRCTVFMNSSVKQAQKEGASVGDISAGLSYSVVRNALYKVIKLHDAAQLGEHIVVQGGTFLNDAVLRAFELLTEREVVRPNIAGLMGAFGAALIAQSAFVPGRASALLSTAALKQLHIETELTVCKLCQNHCQCTISTFDDGSQYVSGNRCERAGDSSRSKSTLPNLFDYKYKRMFAYRRLTEAAATRGDIGVPRALNMYENYPLWFTLLTKLGFRVLISGRSSHELFEKGMDSIASDNICYPAKLVHGHIMQLIERGVKTIFYPSVSYEQELIADSDNHFNCPIVTSYPQVIQRNIDELREGGITVVNPFLNLSNRPKLVEQLGEAFADWQIGTEEMAAALEEAFAEDARARADVRQAGREALAFIKQAGIRGIVLAGRPYHIDPEVHHGIPELINGLGLAVLTEDSVLGLAELERPLRVRDQWAYHSRLYEAAAMVAEHPELELVQLNSFGCGLDAITSDQVAEIVQAKGDVYTLLKIDEVSNLGAARIRLRSLAAAAEARGGCSAACGCDVEVCGCGAEEMETESTGATYAGAADTDMWMRSRPKKMAGAAELAGLANNPRPVLASSEAGRGMSSSVSAVANVSAADNASVAAAGSGLYGVPGSHAVKRVEFTKEMKAKHTIIAPQLSPIHFRLVEAAFRSAGYKVEILEHAANDDVERGLKHVNNDACFPAIMAIGQLINAFAEGRYDPDETSVMITQTGGMCRATNYVALLRKGLAEAGYGQVAVVAISASGLEKNSGFTISPGLVHRALCALALGDLLQSLLLRVRPYEAVPGSADALYERWNAISREFLQNHRRSATWGGRLHYKKLVAGMVAEFDRLELRDILRKPRVGIVGEILVKFHPDANNNVVGVIESEDCEAVLPGLMEFMMNGMYVSDWNYEHYGIGKYGRYIKHVARWWIDHYRNPVRRAIARTDGKFTAPGNLGQMRDEAAKVASLGNQAGEGWLLTAEILELLTTGVLNVICVQPFACLPNHVVGRGMFGEIRRQHPEANLVAIDYDPGASEVNQINRIKLMLTNAHAANGTPIEADGEDFSALGSAGVIRAGAAPQRSETFEPGSAHATDPNREIDPEDADLFV